MGKVAQVILTATPVNFATMENVPMHQWVEMANQWVDIMGKGVLHIGTVNGMKVVLFNTEYVGELGQECEKWNNKLCPRLWNLLDNLAKSVKC